MITTEQETAIRDVLATMPHLAVGMGTKKQACSVAALNLALTGTLTDTVPACMSKVIGRWIISVQDRMPATIRDSFDWRELLVLSAGTGNDDEPQRREMVLSWMWDALALLQPFAAASGFGGAWATMLREQTPVSAQAAYAGADEAAAKAGAKAGAAAKAATAAGHAAAHAHAAAAAAADAAAWAARNAATAATAAAAATAWDTIDPVGLLRRLVAVTDERAMAVQP